MTTGSCSAPMSRSGDAIDRVFPPGGRLGSARQVTFEFIAEGQALPRRTVGQRRIRWARASYGAAPSS